MRLNELSGSACPLARSMVEVGDLWALLVVREVFLGTQRFSEMQRHLGVARNILSARLKKLVDCGVLRMVAGPRGTQVYELTEKGRDLKAILLAYAEWGTRWLPPDPTCTALPAHGADQRHLSPGHLG